MTLVKKMSNGFWKEVFCAVKPFMQGAIFCYPEKIISAPFWDNPYISRNNRAIKRSSFPNIAMKIDTISDFYNPVTGQLFTKEQFEDRYGIEVDNNDYIEIKFIIKSAFINLGLRNENGILLTLPAQPLLIAILNMTKTGCGAYVRLLEKKSNLRRPLTKSEAKWHSELECTFNIDFWNNTYTLAANIKNDNRLRWFQYQINRNCLFTNYRVNKFKNHISPLCNFCSHLAGVPHHNELVSHLFF